MSEQITIRTAVSIDVDAIAYALRDDPHAALAFVQRLMVEVAVPDFAVLVRDAATVEIKAGLEREAEFDAARRGFSQGR